MKIAVTAFALLVLSACGGGSDGGSFAQTDPHGFEACSLLAKSKSAAGENKISGAAAAGAEAAKSSAKSIRASSEPIFDDEAMAALEGTPSAGMDVYFPDVKKLTKACTDEGFHF